MRDNDKRNCKVGVVVVLYNPNKELTENLLSYSRFVDVIYCVDNSLQDNSELCSIDNVIYLPQYENLGLAKALNIGCERAIFDGADIIITFDQDTYCDSTVVNTLVDKLSQSETNIVISPNIKYIYREEGKRCFSNETYYSTESVEVDFAITSGTTFKSTTYQEVGAFDERLFVSQIDQDFCCRLKKSGYTLLRVGDSYIYQEFGNVAKRKVLGKVRYIASYSEERYFLIFRNEIYLRRKWGNQYNKLKVKLYKYVLTILLFEKNKILKLLSCLQGVFVGIRYC